MKYQRGIVWWVYALVALFVFGAGSAIVWKYNSAISKAEKLEAETATLRESLKDQLNDNMFLRAEKTRTDAILARREGVRQGETKARGEINATLQKLFRDNPQAKEWGDQPIPPAVLDSLRLRPATSLEDKNAARVPAGKPAR